MIVNSRVSPTPAFQRQPDMLLEADQLMRRLRERVGAESLWQVDATGLGLALLGDSIASNLFLLGFACQLGMLPVGPAALRRAIEINAVAVEFNLIAFAAGRLQAVDPSRVQRLLTGRQSEVGSTLLTRLEDVIAHRVQLLTDYQDATYAQRYQRLVEAVAAAEARVAAGSEQLALAVARNFARLMVYKDEYEVGRLYSNGKFKQHLRETFADGGTLRYHLAPPLIARRDPRTGYLLKREFGPRVEPVFAALARLKFLRGTRFDLFGYTAERKLERALIDGYENQMTEVANALNAYNYRLALDLASLPTQIRGYGHVKEASIRKARALQCDILARFRHPPAGNDTLETIVSEVPVAAAAEAAVSRRT